MKTCGIIGMGEVGRAIKQLAEPHYTVKGRDIGFDELTEPVDLLHLCYPFNDQFVPVAVKAIQELKPTMVIIHATVKPGTTREIWKATQVSIAHCPIMGVHPHLADYQTTFIKAIGAINNTAYTQAVEFWQTVGVKKLTRFDRPEESEMAKLLCTTYYGWNILFNKLVHRLCEQQGYNFNQVYTEFNQIYNEGYQDTLPNVRRPNLTYVPGPIGGHCVLPNLKILAGTFKEPEFKAMLDLNDELSKY